jgi:dTDP-glucose 4,6-dehydratase
MMSAALPLDDIDLVLSLTPEFCARFGGSRIFITGGTGFVGSWLLEVIQRANDTLGSGIDMLVLTRDTDRARRQLPHVFERPDTILLAGDVTSLCAADAVGKFDLCVHAATEVGDPHKAHDALKVFDSIVEGTRRVLDLAAASGASRFLLTSSGAVYGAQPATLERIAESYSGAPDPLSPAAAYGNGKRAAEWLTSAYSATAHQPGMHTSIARIFAVLGPRLPLNGSFAAGNFIRDAIAGDAIRVQGDGRPLRSYLYMADVCVWLLRILGAGAAGQAYNVGSQQAVSIEALARHIADAAGGRSRVEVAMRGSPAVAPPRYVPDTHKARSELGLDEYHALDSALSKTINWSRSANVQ